MSSRRLLLMLCCFRIALACAGKSDESVVPGAGGTSGVAGAGGSAGSTLRPPVVISDDPAILGASPVKCVGTPTPDPALLRSCVLAAGCAPALLTAPLSDCIAKALPTSSSYPDCLSSVVSCAEVDACTGVGVYTAPCPTPGRQSCVGSKVVYCDTAPSYFDDCAVKGVACMEHVSDDGEVDFAYCGTGPCGAATNGYVCDGTRRLECDSGVADGEDCAARGLGCVDTADGAICRLDAPSCEDFGAGTCTTTSVGTYCGNDGRTQALDCTPLGFTCQAAPNQTHGVACLAPGCAVEDAALCFEECDGPMAHLCVGGQRLSIDCPSYGFPSCVLENRSEVGDRARCGL
jgi:hypothetical protein